MVGDAQDGTFLCAGSASQAPVCWKRVLAPPEKIHGFLCIPLSTAYSIQRAGIRVISSLVYSPCSNSCFEVLSFGGYASCRSTEAVIATAHSAQ